MQVRNLLFFLFFLYLLKSIILVMYLFIWRYLHYSVACGIQSLSSLPFCNNAVGHFNIIRNSYLLGCQFPPKSQFNFRIAIFDCYGSDFRVKSYFLFNIVNLLNKHLCLLLQLRLEQSKYILQGHPEFLSESSVVTGVWLDWFPLLIAP